MNEKIHTGDMFVGLGLAVNVRCRELHSPRINIINKTCKHEFQQTKMIY